MKPTDIEIEACPHSARCGGCRYAGCGYDTQLEKKREYLQKLLSPYGEVLPVLPAEEPLHYRNKVIRSFGFENGKAVSGMYEEHSRRLFPVPSCLLEDEGADRILSDLAALCAKQHIRPFDVRTKTGTLRHAMVRAGTRSGEYLLVLVTGTQEFPGRNNLVTAIRKAHPEITSVVQNVNASDTGIVLGQPGHGKTTGLQRVLYGPGFIRDTLSGLSFRISADSFYQVNTRGAERLYETAIRLAGLTGRETVLDAYCGIGTIGLCAAASVKEGRVIGVEQNADAIRDAIENAHKNHITNARFYPGDAGKFLEERTELFPDVVFMDPPRSGADGTFLSALCRAHPEKVVYISCGPEALARDLRTLTRDYRVTTIQPVDLFPLTEHVETVCLLVLRNPVTHINIDVDVEDLVQDKRGVATYDQIRDYVKEQTGLHVTNLNIAQIKRKCGIIESWSPFSLRQTILHKAAPPSHVQRRSPHRCMLRFRPLLP